MLRGGPGRKAVIQFSSGIERTGEDNQVQLRAATDAANRSNVPFYTVEAREQRIAFLKAKLKRKDEMLSRPAG
jgi:hypothetical protein